MVTMAATMTCRLCLAETDSKYSIGIFTVAGEQQRWAARISLLLQVPVSPDDGLPASFGRGRSSKVLSLVDKL